MEAGCASTLRHGELSGPARWTRWPLVSSIMQGGEGQGEGPSVLAVLGVGGVGSLGSRRMRARRQEGPEEQQGGLGRRR